MNNRQEKTEDELTLNQVKIDRDLVCCPITRQIMRHPVLAADGWRYEASSLLAYLAHHAAVSPMTRGNLLPVVHDRQIDQFINHFSATNSTLDRYQAYDLGDIIERINENNFFTPEEARQLGKDIGRRVFSFFFLYLSFSILLERCLNVAGFNLNDTPLENSQMAATFAFDVTLAMLLTCYDATLRLSNANEYGMLGAIEHNYYSLFTPQVQHHFPENQAGANPANFPAHRLFR